MGIKSQICLGLTQTGRRSGTVLPLPDFGSARIPWLPE
jgi:hypothetical protein